MRKNFRSADGITKRVVCTNGHIILVHKEWKSLPDWAWKAAYAEGCVSEDMIGTGYNTEQHIMTKDLMKDFFRRAMVDNLDVFHPTNNFPVTAKVRKHFPEHDFTAEFIRDTWKEFQKEAE